MSETDRFHLWKDRVRRGMCRTVGIEAITFASVRLSYSCRKEPFVRFPSNKDVPHWLEMTGRCGPRTMYEWGK